MTPFYCEKCKHFFTDQPVCPDCGRKARVEYTKEDTISSIVERIKNENKDLLNRLSE